MKIPGIEDIKDASITLSPILNSTPLLYSYKLSERFSANIHIKLENFQKTGSFKIRGIYNKIKKMSEERLKKGVITFCDPNFGYALSYIGKLFDMPTTIMMQKNTGIDFDFKKYGSEIIWEEADIKDRTKKAKEIAKAKGYTYINPIEDPDIISGYGTIALEILREEKSIEVAIIPVEHGSLISGFSIFSKGILPQVKIIGAYKEGFLNLNKTTSSIIDRYVDELLPINDSFIKDAMKFYLEDVKIVPEERATYPLALLLGGKIETKNRSIALLVSGGNIDTERLKTLI